MKLLFLIGNLHNILCQSSMKLRRPTILQHLYLMKFKSQEASYLTKVVL